MEEEGNSKLFVRLPVDVHVHGEELLTYSTSGSGTKSSVCGCSATGLQSRAKLMQSSCKTNSDGVGWAAWGEHIN